MAKGGKRSGAGRKKGTPNAVTADTREWAAKLKRDHNVDSVVAEVMRKGQLRDKLIVWKVLSEYERGKPVQPISGKDGEPVEVKVTIQHVGNSN